MDKRDLTNQKSHDIVVTREPKNVYMDNVCPHCERRLYHKGDAVRSRRRYIPPSWFRDMFKYTLGLFPLGYYRVLKCEVCRRTLAVFDDNSGQFRDEAVVLYACTLLSLPMPDSEDGESCYKQDSCYGCPLKNGELYVERQ